MRVFCSQCGTPNEGQPGTKVMCTNCTAVFDVPAAQDPGLAKTVMSEQPTPPNPSQPGAVPATGPSASWGAPAVNPGHPGPLYNAPAAPPVSAPTDGLAIASLVLGIICCFPFNVAAIICGALAIQKINANPVAVGGKGLAIAGVTLGSISVGLSVLGIIISIVSNH